MAREREVVRGVDGPAARNKIRKGAKALVLPAEVGCMGDANVTVEGIRTIDGYIVFALPCGMVVRVRGDSGVVVGRTALAGKLSCPPATLGEVRRDVEAVREDCRVNEDVILEALLTLCEAGRMLGDALGATGTARDPHPAVEESKRVLRSLHRHLSNLPDTRWSADDGALRDEVCGEADTQTRIFGTVGDMDGEGR